MLVIIVSSHYSTTAAKLSGRNAVQVLATLFLLLYAKLLCITITAFSFTIPEYPDGSVKRIRLYDGNVEYLKGKRIVTLCSCSTTSFHLPSLHSGTVVHTMLAVQVKVQTTGLG